MVPMKYSLIPGHQMKFWRVLVFAIVWLGLNGSALAVERAEIEREFQRWLINTVAPRAIERGVSPSTFETAFTGVTLNWDLPDLVFPGMAPAKTTEQSQAEFRAPARYFRQNGLQGAAATGRDLAVHHGDTLRALERKTGVPGRIILAIWSRESAYGRVPIPHNAFQVLATRAYGGDSNDPMGELIAALEIAQAGHVPVRAMKSSRAGALGQPQFMPTNYLAFGVDGDGNGRVDIWGSQVDTMASIANFLMVHGWDSLRDWGYEVRVPDTVSCALEGPDQGRTIAVWEAMGITRVSGRAFPQAEHSGESFLMMPAGRHGPAFLVTPNFYVLKRYNRSDLYALYVGHLGDRIQYGMGDFTAPWAGVNMISRSNIFKIQQGLQALGHDVGGVDGLPGFKTRRSIGRWQDANGHGATCFPDPQVAKAIGG